MTPRHPLGARSALVLDQALGVLRALDDATFATAPAGLGARSSFGAHVRHVWDAYDRFLAGLASGEVDYDARRRDRRMETDRAFAVERLEELAQRMRSLPSRERGRELRVRSDVPPEIGAEEGWTGSSVERELAALASHAVHHFAILAVYLRLAGREVPEGFGVAPSTLVHWSEQASCAPSPGSTRPTATTSSPIGTRA